MTPVAIPAATTTSQKKHVAPPVSAAPTDSKIIHDRALRDSFLLCQVMFFGLTLVTIIEALRTNNVMARGIMNLESAVSLVAGYVYTIFGQMANDPNTTYQDITRLRYYDWFCTTPMLLLTLILFFSYESGKPIAFSKYAVLFVLNFLMLYFGYLGETGAIERNAGGAVAFVFYGLLVAAILYMFVLGPKGKLAIDGFELAIFALFFVVWTSYGIVYYMKDIAMRNRIMNCLDVVAKIFIGILLWAHVSGIVEFTK